MARYNKAISVTFNDNDGRVSWSANPESTYDIERHYRIFGKYRARWIFLKRFWQCLMWHENQFESKNHRPWIIKAEIPE